jgi:hypothetical protein
MEMSILQELMSLTEAKAKTEPNHDECVKFVEGWVAMGDAEEMAEEGASLAAIMKQFWGDVDDDSDRRAEAKKIGLSKAMAKDIMANTLDNKGIELGRPRSDESLTEKADYASERKPGSGAKLRWLVKLKRGDGKPIEKKVTAATRQAIKNHFADDFISADPMDDEDDDTV